MFNSHLHTRIAALEVQLNRSNEAYNKIYRDNILTPKISTVLHESIVKASVSGKDRIIDDKDREIAELKKKLDRQKDHISHMEKDIKLKNEHIETKKVDIDTKLNKELNDYNKRLSKRVEPKDHFEDSKKLNKYKALDPKGFIIFVFSHRYDVVTMGGYEFYRFFTNGEMTAELCNLQAIEIDND